MNKKDIPLLVLELNKLFPDATTELNYSNEYQLLVAIILSAQTTDKQVNKSTDKLFMQINSPLDGVNLGTERIKKYIKTLNYYNNKAKYIYETSKILYEEYDSIIPKTLDTLLKLPGVGIKTAKVFLAVTLDAPYIGVDTHVHRVLNRLGLVKTKSPLETDKVISNDFIGSIQANLHNTLVLYGRYYCQAGRPKCKICPFKSSCNYYKSNET